MQPIKCGLVAVLIVTGMMMASPSRADETKVFQLGEFTVYLDRSLKAKQVPVTIKAESAAGFREPQEKLLRFLQIVGRGVGRSVPQLEQLLVTGESRGVDVYHGVYDLATQKLTARAKPPAERETSTHPSGIGGKWVGFDYSGMMRGLSLDLTTDKTGNIAGQLRIYRAYESQRRATSEAVVKVSGVYDSASGAFELRPVKWVEPRRGGVAVTSMAGLYVASPDALTGLNENGHFVLVRAETAKNWQADLDRLFTSRTNRPIPNRGSRTESPDRAFSRQRYFQRSGKPMETLHQEGRTRAEVSPDVWPTKPKFLAIEIRFFERQTECKEVVRKFCAQVVEPIREKAPDVSHLIVTVKHPEIEDPPIRKPQDVHKHVELTHKADPRFTKFFTYNIATKELGEPTVGWPKPGDLDAFLSDEQLPTTLEKLAGNHSKLVAASQTWLTRLAFDYEKIDNRTYLRWILFDDAHFKESFGRSADALTPEDRKQLSTAVNSVQLEGAMGGAQLPLASIQDHTYEQIFVATKMLRELQRYRALRLKWLEQMEPDVLSWSQLDRFESKSVPESVSKNDMFVSRYHPSNMAMLSLLWPSEQSAVVEELAATRKRIAVPVATKITAAALVEARGIEGAKRLSLWSTRHADLLAHLDSVTRQKLTTQVDAKLDALLEESVVASVAELSRIDTGAAAVRAGNQWYRDMFRTYSFALRRPGFVNAIGVLQKRRDQDLSSAINAITTSIQQQKSVAAVDATMASWLAVPGDRTTRSGKSLVQIAVQAKGAIDRANLLAQFSPYEQSLMAKDKPGIVNVPPAKLWRKPTSDEIRLAMMRALINRGGKKIDDRTVRFGIEALRGLATYRFVFKDVRVFECKPAAGGGFVCKFQLTWGMELSEEMSRFFSDSIQGRLMRMQLTLNELETHNKVIEEAFILTKSGWRAPTLETRAAITQLFSNALNSPQR